MYPVNKHLPPYSSGSRKYSLKDLHLIPSYLRLKSSYDAGGKVRYSKQGKENVDSNLDSVYLRRKMPVRFNLVVLRALSATEEDSAADATFHIYPHLSPLPSPSTPCEHIQEFPEPILIIMHQSGHTDL